MQSNSNLHNHNSQVAQLPPLSAAEQQHSDRLTALIKERIMHEGGISFAQFMQMALYQPEYGYYVAGQQKFGRQGDFITAPEVSALFSYALANQCAQVLCEIEGAGIVEFGAGSGKMACDILRYLDQRQSLPAYYRIVEVSAELKQRQFEYLQQHIPHLMNRVEWLSDLEGCRVDGVVLANEVLDAMPVHRFEIKAGQVYEHYIALDHGALVGQLRPACAELSAKVKQLQQSLRADWAEGYSSEANLSIKPWLSMLRHCLNQGVILCIDYGYPRAEYYLPERDRGTLMCHYKHRAHHNPFANIGVQDITAYVDFTDVVESAAAVGLQLEGFTSQAHFLSACKIDEIYQAMMEENPGDQISLAQQIKTLMLPGEMGERFKVIGLSCNYPATLCGFSHADYSNRL